MPTLESVLANIPGLAGYEAARQLGEQRSMNQLAQMGALQKMLAQQDAMQKERAMRTELDALGTSATPEQLARVATKYAPAKDVLHYQLGSADARARMAQAATDRKNALEARLYDIETRAQDRQLSRDQQLFLAQQTDATRREIAAMVDATRRFAMDNRQPEAPVAVIGPDGRPVFVSRQDAIGKTPWSGSPEQFNVRMGKDEITNARFLRREFDADPTIKRLGQWEPQLDRVASYMEGLTAGKTKQSGADDEALVKLYLSMNHPKGDQISNLDRKVLSNFAHLPSRVISAISSFIGGRDLGSDARTMIWENVIGTAKNADAIRNRKASDLVNRAKSQRVRPTLIFSDDEFSRYGLEVPE